MPVVQNCAILKQYCELLDAVIKYESKLAEGATTIEAMQAFQNAINECIEKGILPDYLRRKSSEVVNMFLDEYDYDTDIEVQREEAHEEGVEEKAEEDAIALLNENLSPELIARCIKLPLEKVLELQKQIKETAQA